MTENQMPKGQMPKGQILISASEMQLGDVIALANFVGGHYGDATVAEVNEVDRLVYLHRPYIIMIEDVPTLRQERYALYISNHRPIWLLKSRISKE